MASRAANSAPKGGELGEKFVSSLQPETWSTVCLQAGSSSLVHYAPLSKSSTHCYHLYSVLMSDCDVSNSRAHEVKMPLDGVARCRTHFCILVAYHCLRLHSTDAAESAVHTMSMDRRIDGTTRFRGRYQTLPVSLPRWTMDNSTAPAPFHLSTMTTTVHIVPELSMPLLRKLCDI